MILPFLLRKTFLPQERFSFFSIAFWISVTGVALSVALLVVVLSVMSGFQDIFKQSYVRMTSDAIVLPKGNFVAESELQKSILDTRGVRATSPFLLGQAMILYEGKSGGVTLEGIDLKSSLQVTPWKEIWVSGPDWALQEKTPNWIWLGKSLAEKLKITPGKTVHLFLPEKEQPLKPFVVTAITKFGIYNQDLRFAIIDRHRFSELGQSQDNSLFKVKWDTGVPYEQLMKNLRKNLSGRVSLKRWSDVHQNIFQAIEHQKGWLFLILEIIVILAVLNVVNLLLMQAHQKKKALAILRATGFSKTLVLQFFLWQGLLVGILGTLIGNLLGLFLCRVLEKIQPSLISESIYNVTKLPFANRLSDMMAISAGSLFICFIFSLWPAVKTSREPIVQVLKNE